METNQPLTVRQVQHQAGQRLSAGDFETPALDARILVQHALGLTHEALISAAHRPLDAAQVAQIEHFLARRLRREPVSRIIGKREFYGRTFEVTPDVLDPRPDTEVLVEWVIGWVRERAPGISQMRILDIGTGSGAIIVSLMAELPNTTGAATDISQAALDVARANASRLLGRDCIDFIRTSWIDGVTGEFDIIVSNPPYIGKTELDLLPPDVAEHDPPIALDGGLDGLESYRAFVPAAYDRLVPGGVLCVEIGAGLAAPVCALMWDTGLAGNGAEPQVRSDLAGRPRIVIGRKQYVSNATQL